MVSYTPEPPILENPNYLEGDSHFSPPIIYLGEDLPPIYLAGDEHLFIYDEYSHLLVQQEMVTYFCHIPI